MSQPTPFTHTFQYTEYRWFASNMAALFQANYRQEYQQLRPTMQVGDLVRYRQGALDKVGIVTGQKEDGDYWVQFADGCAAPCRWRNLEIISASR
jgi:hypothetical protein